MVCCVLLGYLKKHHSTLFHPPLPLHKLHSVQRLGFGTNNKIYVEFDSPWWDADCEVIYFVWEDEVRCLVRCTFTAHTLGSLTCQIKILSAATVFKCFWFSKIILAIHLKCSMFMLVAWKKSDTYENTVCFICFICHGSGRHGGPGARYTEILDKEAVWLYCAQTHWKVNNHIRHTKLGLPSLFVLYLVHNKKLIHWYSIINNAVLFVV